MNLVLLLTYLCSYLPELLKTFLLLPRCLLPLKLFSRNEILKKHKLEFFEMVLSHASIKSYYHQKQISKVYQPKYVFFDRLYFVQCSYDMPPSYNCIK